MIIGLQVISLVFALIMIYFAYLHYRRGDLNGFEILFWLISWIGAVLIILFPNVFTIFAGTIAISRAFDLAVIGGFIVIIPLVYSSYVKTKRIERKLEDFIRSEALKKLEDGKRQD